MAYNWADSNRQTVLSGTEALIRTSQSLERSQRTAIETEQVGYSVISDLGVQRESLERTRSNLIDTGEQLEESHKLLNVMKRRVFANKFILISIIVVEMLILGLMVYVKFFKK